MKKIIIALAIVIIVITITGTTAFFINNIYDKEFSAKIVNSEDIIYPKNTWYIDFNKKLDEVTVNDSSVYIKDSNNEKVEINISLNKENNLLKLKPTEYLSGWKTYTLVVNEKVKSENGESVKENIEKKINMNTCNFKISTEEVKKVESVKDEEDLYFLVVNGLKKSSEKIEFDSNDLDKDSYDKESIINYITDYLPFLNLYVEDIKFSIDGSGKSTVNINYSIDADKVKKKKEDILKRSKEFSGKLKNIKSDIEKENMVYENILDSVSKPSDPRLEGKSLELDDLKTEEIYEGIEKYEYTTVENYFTLNYLDMFCIVVNGKTGDMSHSWNIAKIDKKYVHIDMPWSIYISSSLDYEKSYRFFNTNDDILSNTHSWNDLLYPKCEKIVGLETFYDGNLYEVENKDDLYDFFKKAIMDNMDVVLLKFKTEDVSNYNLNEILTEIIKNEKEYININFSRFDSAGIVDGKYTYMEIYLKQN